MRIPGGPPLIRASTAADAKVIRNVVVRAFGRQAEADLVEALLADRVTTISLVAEEGGTVVGHILLSALGGMAGALALAPLAVEPERQKRGIGSLLIAGALEIARARGFRAIFVLGEPGYYGRFGFRAELAKGAIVPWVGPHFMAVDLVEGALQGLNGPLVYAPAFSAL